MLAFLAFTVDSKASIESEGNLGKAEPKVIMMEHYEKNYSPLRPSHMAFNQHQRLRDFQRNHCVAKRLSS